MLTEKPQELVNDDPDNNIRYVGVNPGNYVWFNDEYWRVIGIFDVSNGETTEKRIKLLRDSSLGNYAWDSSESNVNLGLGVNVWQDADLMYELNGDYLNYNLDHDTYWYNDENETKTAVFDHTKVLKQDAQELIDDVIWTVGTNPNNSSKTIIGNETCPNIHVTDWYAWERSNNTSKVCSTSNLCNDTKNHVQPFWKGKVGLAYASDYIYSTFGGSVGRETCMNGAGVSTWAYPQANSWRDGRAYHTCAKDNWIYHSWEGQWLMTPTASQEGAFYVYFVWDNGSVYTGAACYDRAVRPAVYLKPQVKVVDGEGTAEKPFILSL